MLNRRFLILMLLIPVLTGSQAFAIRDCRVAAKIKSEVVSGEFMSKVRIAAVQFPVSGGLSIETYHKRIEEFVVDAKEKGADLVLFPELATFATFKNGMTDLEQIEVLVKNFEGFVDHIAVLSKKYNVAILGGSSPRMVDGKILNTAYLVFPDGRRVYQDKLFLTPDERDWNWTAGTKLNVFKAPWGKSTILICHDCEIPRVSDLLAKEYPEVFLVPSMTEGISGFQRVRWTALARAVEHRAYVVHTGTVGRTENGWENFGQAAFIGPSEPEFKGVIAEGLANQGSVIIEELDLGKLRLHRASDGIYPARSQTDRKAEIVITRE